MSSSKEAVERSEVRPEDAKPEGNYYVQALDRGLEILSRIAENPEGLPLEAIMKSAGLSKATAFRLIWNLERRGLVKKNPHAGYALGHRVLELADAYQKQFPLAELAAPYLRRLRDDTLETTGLIVRQDDMRICVLCFDSPQSVRRTLRPGIMGPLYRGAAGRMLLAHLPRSEQEKCMSGMDRIEYADGTVISLDEFLDDLSHLKREGSALSHMDSAADLWAVAAPVFDRVGNAVAAIACTGPVNRFHKEHVAQCRLRTIEAARVLSAELGWKN